MFPFEKWSHWESLGYLDHRLSLAIVLGGTTAATKFLEGELPLRVSSIVSTKRVTLVKKQHRHLENSSKYVKPSIISWDAFSVPLVLQLYFCIFVICNFVIFDI